jgi:DNA-binding MarR family transcriptional regulator/YHS domain-containing protein
MFIDPVCGMAVRVTPETPISEHQGVVYSFCAAVCKRRFDREPARFVGAETARGAPSSTSAVRARKLGRLLRRLARQLGDPASGAEDARDVLAPVEQVALLEIGERRRVRMSELARACGTVLSTMTGLVDRLEQRGYVRRVRADADRRVVHVELAPAGARAFRERLEADMRVVIALLDALSSKEQAAVVRALDKVTAALDGRSAERPGSASPAMASSH